jgi:hypothetical protein
MRAASAIGYSSPSTTILPLVFVVGQIGDVMPAANATRCRPALVYVIPPPPAAPP